MPPKNKKKKAGRNNKKKGSSTAAGRQNVNNSAVASSTGRTADDAGTTTSQATLLRRIPKLPTFRGKTEVHATATAGSGGSGGCYEIYKQSTTRFWEWMKQALPKSKMTSVNDLRKGADTVLELNIASLDDDPPNPIIAPRAIMDDLSMSIKYRELFTETKYIDTGGDNGHRYMVDVLKYCRSVLRFGRHVGRVAVADFKETSTKKEKDIDGVGGRFGALILDDDDGDDVNLEEEDVEVVLDNIRKRSFPTFTPPVGPKEDIDIEKVLINGDDRFQAVALLRTMDDLMGSVDDHYGLLKNFLRGKVRHEGSAVQLVMECAAAGNMAIESIVVAENALASSHPHLSSFYHVMALVFLPTLIAEIEKMVKPEKLAEDHHMALHFVAEVVECAFHIRGEEKIPSRVKRFVKKSGIRLADAEAAARKVHVATSFELQLAQEECLNSQLNSDFDDFGCAPHSWLHENEYIGGDRCILNTQNIVQKIMSIVQDRTKLVGRQGFWGQSFDEQNRPASRIRGDLDETLAACILPELVELCKNTPFERLPETSQLITVLDLLHRYVRGDRTTPVPIALSFGLHVVLTSIFVLQGDGDIARVASMCKQSYNKLFVQLEELSDESRHPQNAPVFYLNIGLFKNLVNLAKPFTARIDQPLDFLDPAMAESIAFWNPFVGGEYLLYGTYLCSIGLGSATVDSFGQLRFTLHLYNALKQNIQGITIPFLEMLDRVFTKTKAVWVSGRPEKGSYEKNFWIAWGMSVSEAARIANADRKNSEGLPRFLQNQRMQGSNITRELNEILPEEFSASYRRLVLQDYTDNDGVSEYTIRNTTKEQAERYSSLFDLLTRINITRDSMDQDEGLALNYSVVGSILLEFTNGLSESLGWDSALDKLIGQFPEDLRTGKTVGGRQMRPGGFTASNLNFSRQGLAYFWALRLSRLDKDTMDSNDPLVRGASNFIVSFFEGIDKSRYTFFVEPEEVQNATIGNPLEGSYAYGRTGRNIVEPLPGFLVFKYTRAGEPDVRVIKPGKHTPYRSTPDGDVESPYEVTGCKMRRQPNGKYRHIASYSMDELVSLGWDGAMYGATRGSHAAVGHYVPYIPGYDSDADDEYEPIDIAAGKRAGVIGLPPEEDGLYMTLPDINNPGCQNVGKIHNAR